MNRCDNGQDVVLEAQASVTSLEHRNHSLVYRTGLTPVSFLRRNAAVFPDKIAIVHSNHGRSFRPAVARLKHAQFEKHHARNTSRFTLRLKGGSVSLELPLNWAIPGPWADEIS